MSHPINILNLAINKVAMSPPALDPPADIAFDVLDEQVIFAYLDGFKPGSLLPKNVLEDINPYQYRPSNLPDGIWYIIHSTEKKENEYGLWEVKEEASEVFTNSSISGWRRTLEFYEFVDERRTDWVMQEYRITQKGQCGTNKEKELRAMCRIFLSSAMRPNKEEHPKSKAAGNEGRNHSPTMPSIPPSSDSTFGKGSTRVSLMKTVDDSTTFLSKDDKALDPQQRDISELHYVLNGDYLELDDLADPLSHSSSSDNSGRSSMTFDEYFDPIALLQDLEDNNNQGQQGKDSSSRCSVTASIRPFEVVMQPARSRPLVSATVRQRPSGCKLASSVIETEYIDERVINQSVKKLKVEQRDEGPSFSRGVIASFSTAPPSPDGKNKAAVVKTKGLKKYFCFLPF